VIRTYSYPLKPNRAQEGTLNIFLRACQRLYNGALEERIGAYRRQHKAVTKYDQFKELTTLRAGMRIEMHEFLSLVLHYYPHASPWTKTYEELTVEILKQSRCRTLEEAAHKVGIDRAVVAVSITAI
jgi:hypothetical protein